VSTLSEPSAQELADLQQQITTEGVKAIFVGTTTNPDLAEQIANDVGVQVVLLYAESLSESGGPAATYIDFMRYNVSAIVEALK
jgi:ABC-type Zn uptake system ZnuABC Zn-binding protein ZnuA